MAPISWLTTFLDVPPDRFEAAASFWTGVTGTTLSAPRGEHYEYMTLVPAEGHATLRMQRLDGEPRLHLDLHTTSVADVVERTVQLGAEVVADLGHVVLRSPGGFVFCVVDHHGEHDRGPQLTDPVPHRPDTICVDAPADRFDTEVRFWTELFGRQPGQDPAHPEFVGFGLRHQGLPWNLLVQRLDDDPRSDAHAHLDISAGEGVAAVIERHEAAGAEVEQRFEAWTILRDPAGLRYCITNRPPDERHIPSAGDGG